MIDWITPPPILFRHIALLLLGGIVGGCFIGFLIALAACGFTHSTFVTGFVIGISVYATLVVGYHWLAQEQGWASLRTRFASVGAKPLFLGAFAAVVAIAITSAFVWLLKWAGIKLADVPPPFVLDSWTQPPLAFFAIVLLAPLAEELIFRGLLLDWLKAKMDVWSAAAILSVIFSFLHAQSLFTGCGRLDRLFRALPGWHGRIRIDDQISFA